MFQLLKVIGYCFLIKRDQSCPSNDPMQQCHDRHFPVCHQLVRHALSDPFSSSAGDAFIKDSNDQPNINQKS